jgi:D-arabinose 1-dehydrogenase-like Zn-dependent alcohol dehydrogenase
MKAAVLTSPENISRRPLRIEQVSQPSGKTGQVVLRVRACGV